jgi:Tfp pilus assembly protein PilF
MGNLFMVKGDVEGAVSQYRTAIDIDPKFAVAHASLGNAFMAKGDVEGAISRYRTAIEVVPKWVDASRLEQWKAGFERLRQSMALRQGGNSFDEFFLAMVHAKLGDKEQARTWYDRAVERMENNGQPNEELIRFQVEAAKLLGVNDKK